MIVCVCLLGRDKLESLTHKEDKIHQRTICLNQLCLSCISKYHLSVKMYSGPLKKQSFHFKMKEKEREQIRQGEMRSPQKGK